MLSRSKSREPSSVPLKTSPLAVPNVPSSFSCNAAGVTVVARPSAARVVVSKVVSWVVVTGFGDENAGCLVVARPSSSKTTSPSSSSYCISPLMVVFTRSTSEEDCVVSSSGVQSYSGQQTPLGGGTGLQEASGGAGHSWVAHTMFPSTHWQSWHGSLLGTSARFWMIMPLCRQIFMDGFLVVISSSVSVTDASVDSASEIGDAVESSSAPEVSDAGSLVVDISESVPSVLVVTTSSSSVIGASVWGCPVLEASASGSSVLEAPSVLGTSV